MTLRHHRSSIDDSHARRRQKLSIAAGRRLLAVELLEPRWMMATDFGDAPAPYATLLSENGARHETIGPTLGPTRDMEANGTHSATANADGVDEDGVTIGVLRTGQLNASVTVNVAGAPTGARLSAWIDFNGDGNWGGPDEQVAANIAVINGANMVTFDVPSTAVSATVFARFRLSTAGNLGVRGAATDGEVEDYAVTIAPPSAGSGLFSSDKTITVTANGAFSVFAADLDGDGDMDALSASTADDSVAWYENNGSETFAKRVIASNLDGARSVIAVDMDLDGDLDVVAVGDTGGQLVWYEQTALRTFTARTPITANGVRSVFVADMDGDRDMDFVTAQGSRVALYTNNGSQSFTSALLPLDGTGAPTSVTAADVDGDGDMDVVWTANDDRVSWFENNGSQTFTARTIATTADLPRSAVPADLDGDGDIDVIVASSDDDTIAWYDNNGSQVFTERIISTTANMAFGVFAADVDGDGDLDALSASLDDDKIAWYQNTGGVFAQKIISTAANAARSVFAADVDGDGDLDVLSASSIDDTIAWYETRPAGNYDGDSDIDGADFLVWQRTYGANVQSGAGADGSGNSKVDDADLALWAAGFGTILSTAAEAPAVSANIVAAGPDGSDEGAEPALQKAALAPGANWFVALDDFGARGGEKDDADAVVARASSGTPAARDAALADGVAPVAQVAASFRGGLGVATDDGDDGQLAELVDELLAEWDVV